MEGIRSGELRLPQRDRYAPSQRLESLPNAALILNVGGLELQAPPDIGCSLLSYGRPSINKLLCYSRSLNNDEGK
jgi:hypothetical protein